MKSRAHGGTLVFWRKSLDKYVSVIDSESSHIYPILIHVPGYPITAHICIYLPQSSLKVEYMEELAKLDNIVVDLMEKHKDISIHIWGDANAVIPTRYLNDRDMIFKFFY